MLDALGLERDVIVEKEHVRGGDGLGAAVVQEAEPTVLTMKHPDLIGIAGAAVCVDYEDLDRRLRLITEAREALGQELLALKVADDGSDVSHPVQPGQARGTVPANG